MPEFFYKALASDGKTLEGVIEAPDRDTAIEHLQLSGYLPIAAEMASNTTGYKSKLLQIWRRQDKVQNKDVINITRELATLLNAGLSLDQALQTLTSLNHEAKIKALLEDLQKRVQSGKMLSEALESQGTVFSPLYINMIKAAEAGGSLDKVLSRLSLFLERNQELRASTITALIYPIILLVVASLSVFALLLFVVPQFVPLFEDAGKALPLATQIVFSLAEWVRQFWWLPLIVFIAGALFFENQLKNTDKKLSWDKWCLGLPLIGDLLNKIEVARFARTLGTLLHNGVSLLESINIVRNVISNTALAQNVAHASEGLKKGERLAATLNQEALFPELMLQLIHVGENSGQLETMLLKVADIYEAETKRTIQRLLSLLEPLLILGLGVVIAFIIVSILMAMLGLNELVI